MYLLSIIHVTRCHATRACKFIIKINYYKAATLLLILRTCIPIYLFFIFIFDLIQISNNFFNKYVFLFF